MEKYQGDKLLGQYDFDGECTPDKGSGAYQTFSVGIFKLIPKARGGVKRGKTICRVKGLQSNPHLVYKLAGEICMRLNRGGWKPKKKSYDAEQFQVLLPLL